MSNESVPINLKLILAVEHEKIVKKIIRLKIFFSILSGSGRKFMKNRRSCPKNLKIASNRRQHSWLPNKYLIYLKAINISSIN